ncbi:MAG: efflux RND transporter periplasmic adaptor subunit [Deltaproteobacteria bacterium]|nr:efflux RND transporter periplasmic adaptor subunit [Deltaproteobacteria bacterium]
MKKRIIVIVFVALLLGVGLFVYLGQKRVQQKELYYSGTIEAIESELAFQVSGRVIRIPVDEGESVDKEQILAELDRSEYQARFHQAEANLEVAARNLRRAELILEIQQKALPAEVARAQANVKALRSGLNELKTGYREQDIRQARLAVLAAEATMKEAEKDKHRYDQLLRDKIVAEQSWDAVALRHEKALREYERAQEKYALFKEGFRKETIESAKAKLAEGMAVLRLARNNLKQIEATEEEMAGARAQVQAAKAAMDLAETQLRYTRLKAPLTGILTSRNVELGEVVSPGRQVFSLSDLSTVDLKIFVGETEIGKVKPGQKVQVKVDTFPGKDYWGKVAYISPRGEFTPKIIQTHKERVKLVYLVKVSVPNPDLELKSGMPADAWLR